MRTKRLAATAAAALLLSALTACGGDDTSPASDESPTGASTPVESAESEPSEPESTESEPEEVSGGYNAQELLDAMKAAVAKNESTHVVMDISGGGQAMTGEGDVSYAGKTTAMQMEMQAPQFGPGTIEMRLVDGVMYMAIPPMTPKGKFIKIDTNDPNSPFGNLGGVTQGDPLATFDAFDAGLRKVKYVGEEEVEGETMDHYVLSVDSRAAAKAQRVPTQPGMPKTVTYDLWLDQDDLMRRMEFTFPGGGGGMTMTMSDWGKPVTVEAPPAGAIMQMPGMTG